MSKDKTSREVNAAVKASLSHQFMEAIKDIQKYINISNSCYKLNNEVPIEIMDESDKIFNLGTNI